MPDGWSHEALTSAVELGLMQGDQGKINPTGAVTRAQAAAILSRTFGGSRTSDVSGFSDLSADAWYYNEMAQAVTMKLFQGDGANMNPEQNITREQTALVLSRALAFSYT